MSRSRWINYLIQIDCKLITVIYKVIILQYCLRVTSAYPERIQKYDRNSMDDYDSYPMRNPFYNQNYGYLPELIN